MKKAQLLAALAAKNVSNDWSFFAAEPFIYYQAGDPGRYTIFAGWKVVKRNRNLSEPGQEHLDHGARGFDLFGHPGDLKTRRQIALSAAKRWTELMFFEGKEVVWKRGPFGGLGRAEFIDQRIRRLIDT